MEASAQTLANQYELVKSSRKVLLNYCITLTNSDFISENSSFGRGSVRNLLVHIAYTYLFWLGQQGMSRAIDFPPYDTKKDIEDITYLFGEVDALVNEFLETIDFDENRDPYYFDLSFGDAFKDLNRDFGFDSWGKYNMNALEFLGSPKAGKHITYACNCQYAGCYLKPSLIMLYQSVKIIRLPKVKI